MASIKGPIFIGGTGRSGTTVLIRMLGRHPDIFAFRWETQFLVAPNGLINLHRDGYQPARLDQFESRLKEHWWRRIVRPNTPTAYEAGLCHDLKLEDLESTMAYLHQRVEDTGVSHLSDDETFIRDFTRLLLGPAARREGVLRWSEKTPRNILFVDSLSQYFPDMKFIHILRDPRDVAASMVERGFWPVASGREYKEMEPFRGVVSFELALRYWLTVVDLGRSLAGNIPSNQYYEVRFEDLIHNTEQVMREICDYLRIEYKKDMIEFDLSRHHIGRWCQDFPIEKRPLIEQILGSRLEEEGYT